MPRLICTLAVLTLAAACNRPKEVKPAPAGPHAAPAQGEAAPGEAAPGGAAPGGAPPGDVIQSGGLTFRAQEGWIVEPPEVKSAGGLAVPRVAQYRLPRVEGDPEDAELAVTSFPGGGTFEANAQRWADQFAQTGGGSSMEQAVLDQREVGDAFVHTFDLSGTLVGSGMQQQAKKPGWRMLAAMIESGQGIYFAKLLGPEATVERWSDSFQAFLDGLR